MPAQPEGVNREGGNDSASLIVQRIEVATYGE
jgi:hypothetical protein